MRLKKGFVLKIFAVITAFLGIPVGIALIDPHYIGRWVIILGVTLVFVLVGLFLWFINQKNKNHAKIISIIIWVGGLLSGLLTGYRHGATPAQPWRWYSGYAWIEVYIGPYIDWCSAVIPWAVFCVLGITLWIRANALVQKG